MRWEMNQEMVQEPLRGFENRCMVTVIRSEESVVRRLGILDRVVVRQSARVKVWNRRIYIAMVLLQFGAIPISSHGSLLKM